MITFTVATAAFVAVFASWIIVQNRRNRGEHATWGDVTVMAVADIVLIACAVISALTLADAIINGTPFVLP